MPPSAATRSESLGGSGAHAARAEIAAIVALAVTVSTHALAAQDTATRSPSQLRPTVAVGAGVLEYDRGGDQPFRGYAVRAGVQLGWAFDLTASVQWWPDLGEYRGRAVQAEASFYPIGRPVIAPYLLLAFGRFSATPVSSMSGTSDAGAAKGVALGVHARVAGPWGVRVEGLARIDASAFDDELRVFAVYAPRPRGRVGPARRPSSRLSAGAMAAFSGPWRFAEPLYALDLTSPVSQRVSVVFTIGLAHWRIGNAWDTRAVVLMPGLQRALMSGRLDVALSAGPMLTVMLEGPDNGVRGGAHLDVSGGVKVAKVRAIMGASFFWFVRSPYAGHVSDSGEDQRGLFLRGGLAL